MNNASDEKIKQELLESFYDLNDEVEYCLSNLQDNSTDELLHKLFRAIHNIKGNAAMLQLDAIVAFTHSIEEVAGSLREHKYQVSSAIAEIFQIAMDRLKDLHHRDICHIEFEGLREEKFNALLLQLSQCTQANVEEKAHSILSFLGYDDIVQLPAGNTDFNSVQKAIEVVLNDKKYCSDLNYFHELALLNDNQQHCWSGRSIQIFDWAMKTNSVAGNPVPYQQFAAAIYLHDLGMSFLPREMLTKKGNYSEDERALLKKHTHWGSEFLSRIPGWEEASIIILDHHERLDGKGYPNGKKGNEIHFGARILAIIDAFFSITLGKADKKQRKSVIRALSEINSNVETQFDPQLVQSFITVIRQDLKEGLI